MQVVLYRQPRKKQRKSNAQISIVEGRGKHRQIRAPVNIGRIDSHSEANIIQNGNNSCRIRHQEYIQDVATNSGSWTIASLAINPGLNTTFPWLSVIASRWEKYKFHNITFLYRAKCSTVTNGSVISNIDYDCLDSPPASKSVMMGGNYVDSSSWASHRYDAKIVNLSDTMKFRYVRTGIVGGTVDLKTYDLGNFNIATDGGAVDIAKVGELHVVYDVELRTPQLNNPVLGAFVQGENGSAALPLGTTTIGEGTYDNIVSANAFSVTFGQAGRYLLDFEAIVPYNYNSLSWGGGIGDAIPGTVLSGNGNTLELVRGVRQSDAQLPNNVGGYLGQQWLMNLLTVPAVLGFGQLVTPGNTALWPVTKSRLKLSPYGLSLPQ